MNRRSNSHNDFTGSCGRIKSITAINAYFFLIFMPTQQPINLLRHCHFLFQELTVPKLDKAWLKLTSFVPLCEASNTCLDIRKHHGDVSCFPAGLKVCY